MPIQGKPAADVSENPYLPPGPKSLVFEDFQGMNTSALRAGVPDEQCYWLDGFMPIGPRNLRTLPGVGAALYTPGGGLTVIWFSFYNLGTTPYMVVFLSDGSVKQVRTTDGAVTAILPASTITSPSIVNCGISQWGRDYLIIVADQANGYWLWDGTLLFKAGTLSPQITITDGGSGYPSSVTVTASGGYGSGSSLTASVFGGVIQSVTVINPGSGYSVNDVIQIAVAPSPSAGTGASITASINAGTLAALSVVASGSGYSGNPSITFVSAAIPFAKARANVTAGSILSAVIVNPGVASGVPATATTVVITDIAITATITAQVMPFGVQGTAVETYQGRVWVAKGPLIEFTAPGSYADFATSNGGGNFTSGDSFLRRAFTRLLQTNGFLYLIGDSSMNYISGVQTSGTPPTTTFTNQNADPQVGSPYPASVQPFGRDIMLANSFGIHVSRGASLQKVSEALDGVYNTVADFGSLQLSSAQATIFGKKVFMTLVKIVDPVSGSTVNKLFMTKADAKVWWASSQELTLIYVAHQEINSVIVAWGTDGTTIKPLFTAASSGFQKVAQSRLWDAPGGYQFVKSVDRLWGLMQYNSTVSPNFSVGIDNQAGQMATPYSITVPAALGYFTIPAQAVAQNGVLIGLTFKTSAADMSLASLMLGPNVVQYRG